MTQRRLHLLNSMSLRLFGASLLLALCGAANAQPLAGPTSSNPRQIGPETRWYQVEVIVFGNNSDPSISPELWRHDINLSYPPNWIELKGFEEPQTELPADATDPLSIEQNSAVNADAVPANEPERDATLDLKDIAFQVLSSEEFHLAKEAQRLARSPNYRVLFHQAWRQPFVENDENVPAILVRGGDIYGDHYELEGTIKVSLRRWLHVETNLWLTQFATNYGQELENWPELPPRPNRALRPVATVGGGMDTFNDGWWQLRPQSTEYDNVLSKPFVIENIVLMKEARKVQRREELHYIDNPQMGVLVYFTQYDLPQPEPEPAPVYDPVIFDGIPPTRN